MGSYTFFMVYSLLCLDIISLQGIHFPSVQSEQLLCFSSPVKGRGVRLLLLKMEKKPPIQNQIKSKQKQNLKCKTYLVQNLLYFETVDLHSLEQDKYLRIQQYPSRQQPLGRIHRYSFCGVGEWLWRKRIFNLILSSR